MEKKFSRSYALIEGSLGLPDLPGTRFDKLGDVFDEINMSTTYRSKLIKQQAYADRILRQRHRAQMGTVKLAGFSLKTGTETACDIIRHCIMMIGILGLVAIAVGATTESIYYHRILNWVSSFFIS